MPRFSEFQFVDFPVFDVIENNAVRRGHVSTLTLSVRRQRRARLDRPMGKALVASLLRSDWLLTIAVCCVTRTIDRSSHCRLGTNE